MPEPISSSAKPAPNRDWGTQAMVDATTWVPVAFFSFLEKKDAEPELCQLWVSVLGQTEWRKVETRNLKDMIKAYAECQSFSESEPDDDFRD